MRAKVGELLPAHLANLESILLVYEGEYVFNMNDKEHVLNKKILLRSLRKRDIKLKQIRILRVFILCQMRLNLNSLTSLFL